MKGHSVLKPLTRQHPL